MCDSEIRRQVHPKIIQRSQQEIQLLQNSSRPERVLMQRIRQNKQNLFLGVAALDSMPYNYSSMIQTQLSSIKLVNENPTTNKVLHQVKDTIRARNQLKSLLSTGHFQNKHKQYCIINIMKKSCLIFARIMIIVLFTFYFSSLFVLFFIDGGLKITFYQCHVHLKFIDQARQIYFAQCKTIDEKYDQFFINPLVQKKSIRHYTDWEMWVRIWLTFKYLTIGSLIFSLLGSFSRNIKDFFMAAQDQKMIIYRGGHLLIMPRVSSINAQSILNRRNSYIFY